MIRLNSVNLNHSLHHFQVLAWGISVVLVVMVVLWMVNPIMFYDIMLNWHTTNQIRIRTFLYSKTIFSVAVVAFGACAVEKCFMYDNGSINEMSRPLIKLLTST